jgi:hypothetical protein
MSQTLHGFVSKWHRQPAPTAAPTRRRYTFAVYIEVPEPVDDDDVDGYTQADVEALMKRLLASYAPAFKGHGRAVADWELMDDEPVTPEPAAHDDHDETT